MPAAGGVAIHRHGAAGHGRAAAAGALLLVCLLVAGWWWCAWRGRFHAPGCLVNPARRPVRAPTLAACQEIGEVLEKEGNKEEAIMFYEQAADLFATENSTSEANKCNLKVRWGV